MTGVPSPAAGQRILVVEDDFFLADLLVQTLQELGVEVVGPVPSVQGALDLIASSASLDGAILDINLRNQRVFPVADCLIEKRVPFVFTSGYTSDIVPTRFAEIPLCLKPCDTRIVLDELLGA